MNKAPLKIVVTFVLLACLPLVSFAVYAAAPDVASAAVPAVLSGIEKKKQEK